MTFDVEKTPEEWRAELAPERFAVLREAATEAPFTGSLLHVDEAGVFTCGGCGQLLFRTEQKFDAHCGWPSFDACEPGSISVADHTQLEFHEVQLENRTTPSRPTPTAGGLVGGQAARCWRGQFPGRSNPRGLPSSPAEAIPPPFRLGDGRLRSGV